MSLFNVALVASPNNPLVRYRRAKIWVQHGNYAVSHDPSLALLRLLSLRVLWIAGRAKAGKGHAATPVVEWFRFLILFIKSYARSSALTFVICVVQAAEDDLVRLCDLSPSEPNVVLLLGKVLRLQGKMTEASRVLAVARDLDPRSAPKIAKLVEENRPIASAIVGIGDRRKMSVSQGAETSVSVEESGVDVSMDG